MTNLFSDSTIFLSLPLDAQNMRPNVVSHRSYTNTPLADQAVRIVGPLQCIYYTFNNFRENFILIKAILRTVDDFREDFIFIKSIR